MARKKKIDSSKTLMDSMLDYLEIEQGSQKDERMNKRNLKKFLKQIADSYERQIVEDIVRKMKDNIENEMDNEPDGDEIDDWLDDTKGSNNDDKKLPGIPPNIYDNPIGDDFNPEIEKFLAWLSAVLYSGDHKIEISSSGNKTNILLIKLDKNGRK